MPIPAPFGPLRLVRSGASEEDPFEIVLWGRSYRFGRGPLPEAVHSQREPLFAEPPRFVVTREGQEQTLEWSAAHPVTVREDAIELRSEARAGGLRIEARTRIEYDGMIRVDLEWVATRPERLQGFEYRMFLPGKVARYFNHHVPYDYRRLRIDKRKLVESAGLLGEQPRRFPFVPTLYVGNRDVGLEWWCETNVGWSGTEPRRPLELRAGEGGVRLRIQPIAGPRSFAAGERWSHRFALFPLPLRPPAVDWRSLRYTPATQARRYDRSIGTRFVWIAFPGHFDARWHGLPASKPSPKQLELRRRLAADGVDYIPYAKLTAAPSLHPKVLENASLWAATRRLFTGTGAAQRHFLEARGWKPGQVYSYSVCMGRRDYLDWMLEESLAAFREERLDGLYYDWGAIQEPCERDPRVRDPQRDEVWSYFEVRDFYRRLYGALKAEDPEALLAIHTQGQPRALAGFVDTMFVGEALNVLFRGGRSFQEIRRNPELYDPDYYALPPGFLEAQLYPRIGGVGALLPQVRHARDPKNPERERRLTRAFFALALVQDFPVWLTNTHPEERVRIFRAIDRFGGFRGARVLPWWSNREEIRRDPAIRVTAYAKPGRALLIVANWTRAPLESELAFDPAALGLERLRRVRDAEAPRRPGPSLVDGRLRVRVPARDLRILLLE